MPRIKVTDVPSSMDAVKARELALFYQAGGPEGVDAQVLENYAPADAVKSLGGEVTFEKFAAAVKAESQAAGAEGEGQYLGWAAHDPSGKLTPIKFARRELGPHDVAIKITHAGMCHSDLHTIKGDWGPAAYPVVPGHEIVGIITAVGDKVTKFKVGDRGGIGCFVDSCRECKYCAKGDEMYCPKTVWTYNSKHYDGFPAQGGYSTAIIMDEKYTLRVPANLPLERAAPLLCAGITVWSPLKDYGLDKAGQKIGVVGLGGLGHMAVKFAKAFGAQVTVLSRSKAKEAEARAMGADNYLVSTSPDEMEAAKGTLDGIIDTVSAAHDVNALLSLLEPRGKLVLVGLPPGQLEVNHFPIIQRHLALAGSVIGNLKDTQEMLDFCGEHNVVCDTEVIDMDYVNEAMKRLEHGDVKFRFVIDIQKSLIQ